MSRHKKNITKILACAVMLALVFPLMNLGGGSLAQNTGNVQVQDHQFIIQELDTSGKPETVRVADWLALKGDGTVDVKRTTGLMKPPKITNTRDFSAPEVKDNTIIWKGLEATGSTDVKNVITLNQLNSEDVKNRSEMLEKMPLELKYTYYLDGKKVKLEDIAGKSGHFRLECYMKNTSKKKEMVTYTDSITGERKTELAEVYLPLAVSPSDWFFDNNVFSNLKCHEYGIISYLPNDFGVNFGLPLFPPASEEDVTIWLEADVKNFSMKPLTITCAFIFPQTNQRDPLPELQAGLNLLYGGVEQLGAGLSQAVAGLGPSGMSETLIGGISQISGGLEQMISPSEGLPYAAYSINQLMVPGVKQAYAAIGETSTPGTMLYDTGLITTGLNQVVTTVGSLDTPGTLLNHMNNVSGSLNVLKSLIGSPTTPNTMSAWALEAYNLMANGIIGGLQEQRSQLQPTFDATAEGGVVHNILSTILALCSDIDPSVDYNFLWDLTFYGGTPLQRMAVFNTSLYGLFVHNAADDPLYPGLHNVIGAIFDGFNDMITALGPPTTYATGLYALSAIRGGLEAIGGGIGSPPTPDTLLYATDQLIGGLNEAVAGMGSPTTPDTALYAITEIASGLEQVKAGTSTGSEENPGLLEGLEMLGSGMNEAVAGVGSYDTEDTLLWGTGQIADGLNLLKDGLTMAVEEGTDVMKEGLAEGLKELNLTFGQLEAITERGEKFDTYLGRVENEGSTSDIRFYLQTKPVQNPNQGNGPLIAIIISLVGAAALVVFGLFAFKQYS